jgi:hypothetical protein
MATPSIAMIPSGYKAGKVYSVLPTDGAGDLTFTRASSATRVNKEGLIETVATGVSRLDYSDGGCPSLLLEPQRTNLVTYSESFSNAYWTKTGSSVVSGFASPSADSPLGAFKLVEDASTGEHRIVTTAFVVSNGTAHSQSYFVKYLNTQWIQINRGQEGVGYLNFDLINGVVGFTGGITNYKISVMSNGWYRISINYTVTGTYATAGISILKTNVNARYETYLGNGTSGVYIYGAQLEAGSYATSYIPTAGAISTRLQDVANGAGDASMFNDSEGVLYAEISALADDGTNRFISLTDGSNDNRILFGYRAASNQVFARIEGNNSASVDLTNVVSDTKIVIKLAIYYDSSFNYKMYINGFLVDDGIGTDSIIGLDRLDFTNATGTENFYGNVKQIQYYNTALTDAELISLTTL